MSEILSRGTIGSLHKIARQRTLLVLIMTMALTAGAIYFSYFTSTSADWAILRSNEKRIVEIGRYRSSAEMAAVISDAAYLSREQYLQAWLANGSDESRQSLTNEFMTFMREKGIYDSIHLIDERGQEMVRVDQSSEGPTAIENQNLQDKSHRYYFAEAISLDRGQVYVSPLELSVEHGVIEQPIKPVARIAMPVFDNEGRKRGIIVLNYEGARVLDRIRYVTSQFDRNIWLLNSQGYWLIGPSPDDEWAFMYPDRRNRSFAQAYHAAWERISRHTGSNQFLSNGDLFTSSTVNPAASLRFGDDANVEPSGPLAHESWILVSRVPAATIASERQPRTRHFAMIFVSIALLEILTAWLVIRHWTARQAAERAADRSEANFFGLIEAAPDAILVSDDAGKVCLANRHAEQLFGFDAGQLIGRTVDDLVPERHRSRHADHRAGFFKTPGPRQMGDGSQLWALRSDGTEMPVDIRLSSVTSGPETLVFTSVRDMTDRFQKEHTIQEMTKRLAHDNAALSSVNAELDTFCYSVSHDLRAPLRGMVGFCQALVEDYGDKLDQTGKDYVQRISAASTRMGQLIDDLLTLSRVTRTEVKRSEVDLSDLVEDVATQLQQSEPDRKVEFKIKPMVTARGDKTLLRTVLENLLGNAWKYSAKNPHATIEFGIVTNGAEPTFYVRDDGVGFDMAHADKLFQPFQRLHRATEFEGNGIGLASVANIVRRHGGRIWAESRMGAGTTMNFTLSS